MQIKPDGYLSQNEIKKISKEMDRDLSRIRRVLRKEPFIVENFGQKEIRSIRDKYANIKYNRSLMSIYDRIDALDRMIQEATRPSQI
jgi:hypothetical protein